MTVFHNQGHVVGPMPARPIGFTLHGTRSDSPTNSILKEFNGTRAYAENSYIPAGDYYTGWHTTVGELMYSVHMRPNQYGWNAGAQSDERIGIEFAQPQVSDPITDKQVVAFIAYYRAEVIPVYGTYNFDDPNVLKCHSELPQGIRDGKTDSFPKGDPRVEDLKRRIRLAAK